MKAGAMLMLLQWLLAPACMAQSTALELDDVLASSRRHFPQILAAVEKTAAQAGKVLASEGAFDLQLENTTYTRALGFYDGKIVDSRLVKPIPQFNAKLYGGYRVADGDFPVYEDELITNGGGEFKLGAVFSLLRDRDIDERRFALRDNTLALAQTELEARLTQVRVQHQATTTYLAWLAAGKALEIYRGLLMLAQARQDGLEHRVAEGDLARVYLNENQQYILKRSGRVAEAERQLTHFGNRLGLFVRNDDGTPRAPQRAELPAEWPALESVDATMLETTIATAQVARPEIGLLTADLERERNRLAIGNNALKTRVDLNLEASRDIGGGSATRDETDAIVRLNVTVPLERRTGRGKVAEARANLSRLELDRQLLNEQIELEIRNVANDINAAKRFVDLAAGEVEQAQILEQAERERFAQGASDFFVVNLREEAAADARVRKVEAQLGLEQALTNFYAARFSFSGWGN